MWQLAEFALGLDSMGLPLLYEDKRFLHDHLKLQPESIVEAALEDYKHIWLEAAEAEPVEHKKSNAGRRAANTFMRTIVWPSLCATISNAA